ncbi:antitoxin [Rhodococcus sp. BL-253-APC-6A1W]|uniref:antitoxin n=1 Tax=Rhodococcus sp. BL-253-APC-6A1W TaxID=2725307 RepID=UPI00146BA6C1|nr:antitoxin [Rhodococcus sp. BL-253-APC-6A1W]NMD95833.1 antitoxin [Rhodococcus sp. BL-253-APC-6A1W]
MGLMDTVKGLLGKGKGYAAQNSDKVDGYIEKAGHIADSKTRGKYSQHIGKAQDAARKHLGSENPAAGNPAAENPVTDASASDPRPGSPPAGPQPDPRPGGGPGPATPPGTAP